MSAFFDTAGNLKKTLLSFLVIGAISAIVGGSTFANFNAQTTNPTNTFAAGTLTMTNVAGSVVSGANCTAETNSSDCATLFSAGTTNFKPGASDLSNTVAITYTGSLSTSDFRLYVSDYSAKAAGSQSFCTAANPASKINLQIAIGSTVIYPVAGEGYGTLDGFATTYNGTATGLQLKGGTSGGGTVGAWSNGDSATYTIKVNLDSSANNAYQGCQSVATLNWYAAQ